MDLAGVGGVSTSCEASIGMVVLHHTVLSKNFCPTDGRLSFPNEVFLFVLTLIQYKMSANEFRRALAQQRQDWEEEAEPAIKTHATKRIKVSNQVANKVATFLKEK
jgi:hypothetical protein